MGPTVDAAEIGPNLESPPAEALECCGDAHGVGLLGSVGVVTPNLGTTRARHADGRRARRLGGTLEDGGETGTDERTDPLGPQPLSYNEKVLVVRAELPTFMPEDPEIFRQPRAAGVGSPSGATTPKQGGRYSDVG